jgi:methyl-accepting chemotaxis protein
MNLTVAAKIIGGFAIISTLLVITSLTSLVNLSTIRDSTVEVSELAIPTLTGSNQLAIALTQIGNRTLKAYYQTELPLLDASQKIFVTADQDFTSSLKKLERLVSKKPKLINNLKKVNTVYEELSDNIDGVFENRKISIEQKALLYIRVDSLEEKADDASTLLLDLADHDLADTKLQRAVDLGENIESLFNGVVSLALEYKDSTNEQTINMIEREMADSLAYLETGVAEVISELRNKGVEDVADELQDAFAEIKVLVSGSESIVANKSAQLNAIALATEKLTSEEKLIAQATSILAKQVTLANAENKATNAMVEDAVTSGNSSTLLIMIISIIASVIIARFTLLSITRPLSRVNEMLNTVASGNLSHKLDDSGTDEFAELSGNCNMLIDSLRNLIQGIVSRSSQLAAAAEQTSTVTAQSTTAIEQQRSQVEQAASATTEMSSTSQTVLSSANDALGEIKQADDEAERVKIISARNRKTIELLANEVEAASQVINQLQDDSAAIGGILDVIRGIADQTNLLALNAAIEAARAGEQGRGFAVVADEVRTLASRTQESTQQINTMIEALQAGAEKAVNVMETGKKQAAECVNQSEEADKALETITHAVHEAYDRSSQIATAAEEQSAVAHEISENLESIVTIAEQTSNASHQTASSSREVASLAEELQQSVQEFTL